MKRADKLTNYEHSYYSLMDKPVARVGRNTFLSLSLMKATRKKLAPLHVSLELQDSLFYSYAV